MPFRIKRIGNKNKFGWRIISSKWGRKDVSWYNKTLSNSLYLRGLDKTSLTRWF